MLAVGIGSPHGDDQIGWIVVQELAAVMQGGVNAKAARQPLELLEWLHDVEYLIVCDACQSGGAAGTLSRWMWPTASLVTQNRSGSHDLTLPFVLALAERLGKLPERVTVWGIELGNALPARPLSSEVRNAIPRIVQTIADDLITDSRLKKVSGTLRNVPDALFFDSGSELRHHA